MDLILSVYSASNQSEGGIDLIVNGYDNEGIRDELENYVGEDWVIDSAEGFGDFFGTSEIAVEKVAFLVEVHDQLDDDDRWEAYLEYADYVGGMPTAQDFEESYAGTWLNVGDWAEEFENDVSGDIPDRLTRFIDWEAYGKYIEDSGDIFTVDVKGAVAVFWNN